MNVTHSLNIQNSVVVIYLFHEPDKIITTFLLLLLLLLEVVVERSIFINHNSLFNNIKHIKMFLMFIFVIYT